MLPFQFPTDLICPYAVMDLYACGLNDCGQIALQETDQRTNEYEFTKIASGESISIIFAGNNETVGMICFRAPLR